MVSTRKSLAHWFWQWCESQAVFFTCLKLHLWACCGRSLSPLYAGSMGCRKCCQRSQPQSQVGWRRSHAYQGSCFGPIKPTDKGNKSRPLLQSHLDPSRCQCEISLCATRFSYDRKSKERDKSYYTHPITIKCRTKVILSISHAVNQICSVSEVRIWVLTPKILQWDTVDGRIGRTAKFLTEYSPHIRSYHWGADRDDREGWEKTAVKTMMSC